MSWFISPWLACWRQRRLLIELTRREIVLSTRGTLLGVLWLVLTPLLLLAVYTFVFAGILPAAAGAGSWQDTGLRIFAALIPFSLFADVLTRCPLLIVAHPNYVKKMVFPVELLPAARVATAAFFSLISLALLLLCQAVVWRHVYIQWLLVPVLYAPLLLLCLGVGWFLAALGVYVRDIAHLSGLLASILLFLTPVFYPLSAAPARVRWLLLCNPLTVIVDSFRQTLVVGAWPDWRAWVLCLAGCFVLCHLGYLWFALTRRGFADVV